MASLLSTVNHPVSILIPLHPQPSFLLGPALKPIFPRGPVGQDLKKGSEAARVGVEGIPYLMLEATGSMWSPQEAVGERRWGETGRKEGYEAWIPEEGPNSLLLRNQGLQSNPHSSFPWCRRKLLDLYSR